VYTTADPAMFLVETEDNHGPADVGPAQDSAYCSPSGICGRRAEPPAVCFCTASWEANKEQDFSMRFFLSALMMVVIMVVYTTADPAMFLVETEDNHGPADVGPSQDSDYCSPNGICGRRAGTDYRHSRQFLDWGFRCRAAWCR